MAGQVLTIYNSGTGYDASSPDLIPVLARSTLGQRGSSWEINPGPGSKQQVQRDLGKFSELVPQALVGIPSVPGLALGLVMLDLGKISELVPQVLMALGLGMLESVEATLALIQREAPSTVNFCGWSRGAITCLMTASALAKVHPGLPVNLFLFDPVIGDPVANPALWKGGSTDVLGSNVRDITVIQMLNEDRWTMQAHLPPSLLSAGRSGLRLYALPGEHSSAVEPKPGPYEKVFSIGLGLSKMFLAEHGTRFNAYSPWSAVKFAESYSALWRALRSTPSVALRNNRYELLGEARRRVPSDQTFSIPNLFFNEHHVQVMQAHTLFPACTRLIAYALVRQGRANAQAIAAGRAELERAAHRADIPETMAVLDYYLSRIRPE